VNISKAVMKLWTEQQVKDMLKENFFVERPDIGR